MVGSGSLPSMSSGRSRGLERIAKTAGVLPTRNVSELTTSSMLQAPPVKAQDGTSWFAGSGCGVESGVFVGVGVALDGAASMGVGLDAPSGLADAAPSRAELVVPASEFAPEPEDSSPEHPAIRARIVPTNTSFSFVLLMCSTSRRDDYQSPRNGSTESAGWARNIRKAPEVRMKNALGRRAQRGGPGRKISLWRAWRSRLRAKSRRRRPS